MNRDTAPALAPRGPRRGPGTRCRTRGVTLTESMVTLAISTVAVGSALPGFDAARERRHLEGVAAQLETDLQLARSEAVAMNRTLRISFGSDAAGACYVLHTGAARDCQCGDPSPRCVGDAVPLRSVRIGNVSGVTLASNVASMVFDPVKGTVTPTGTMRVTGHDGRAIHAIVNSMGRVRTCSPGSLVSGVPAC